MRKNALVFVAALLAAFTLTIAGASAAPAFTAHGSAEQVYVTGAQPGAELTLIDSAGKTVASRKVGALGGALFRGVKPGNGYRVRGGGEQSEPLTVLTKAPAPPKARP